jgi:hypothetical protein
VRRKLKHSDKEYIVLTDKKSKILAAITALKQKTVGDMVVFSEEVTKTKETINTTRQVMLTTIREKLEDCSFFGTERVATAATGRRPVSAIIASAARPRTSSAGFRTGRGTSFLTTSQQHGDGDSNNSFPQNNPEMRSRAPTLLIGHKPEDAEMLLRDTEFNNVEELLTALQHSENTVFALYNETISKDEEVEKMETENKNLEIQVQQQVRRIFSFGRIYLFTTACFFCIRCES